MWEFIKIARIVLQLMPVVIEAIKAVEQAIPGKGAGEQKLAIVRQTIEAVYQQVGMNNIAFDKVWSVMAAQIAALVNTFNDTGVFRKE